MATHRTKFGDRLAISDLDRAFRPFRSLSKKLKKGDTLVFDFSDCRYISPAGVVSVIAFRDIFKDKGVETLARFRKETFFYKYLQAIRAIEQEDFDVYMKRLRKHTVGLKKCMNEKDCDEVRDEIVSQIIRRSNCTAGTRSAMAYMIDEIWVNSATHGYECYETDQYPKPIYFAAFSYSNRVEVAILDLGIGIHESLARKAEHRDLTAREALGKAIEEGVTGHPNTSPGFGLYSASQFTSDRNGSLHIWSSGRRLSWKDNTLNIAKCDFYEGTLVVYEVYKSVNIPFDQIVTTLDTEYYVNLLGL